MLQQARSGLVRHPAELVGALLRPGGNPRSTPTFALPACEIATPAMPAHVVAMHLGGSALVTQSLAGRTRRRTLPRGALTIIPAFEPTEWAIAGPVEFLHLYLAPDLLQAAADDVGGGSPPRLEARFGATDPLLEQLLHTLLKAGADADPLYTDALRRFLILHLVQHHAGAPAPSPPPPAASRPVLAMVLDYIEANLDRPLVLADLAAIAGISVFHFARTFKNAVGTAPHRYVLERRIARAQALLARTRLPLTEVAAACGFANSSHFATVFRRHLAVSPREYRRSSA